MLSSHSVAFLGPAGSYTHIGTTRSFDASTRLVPKASIAAVFDAVEAGETEHGVVPIENSTEGGVNFTTDRLLEASLSIAGEIVLNVEHCLLSNETELSQIKRVHSHPQGLAQCRKWLAAHLPHAELIHSASTSGAAHEVKDSPGSAAISSRLSAELVALPIMFEKIQDREHNATRFIVLGKRDSAPSTRDKTSIVFSTPHEKGALLRVLTIFDARNINLTRIESRPWPDKIWQYVFFTDLEGHRLDANVSAALRELEQIRSPHGLLKVFGSYAVAE